MTTTMVFAYLPQLVKVTFFIHSSLCKWEKDREFGTTQQTFTNKKVLEKGVKMFKINIKDTRTSSVMSGVFIVNFNIFYTFF